VIGYFLTHRDRHLSPWRYILVPAVGAVIDVYLLTQLDSKALVLGFGWLAIGIVYLLVLTRALTREPPEMTAITQAE
jgi:putrescine importer